MRHCRMMSNPLQARELLSRVTDEDVGRLDVRYLSGWT